MKHAMIVPILFLTLTLAGAHAAPDAENGAARQKLSRLIAQARQHERQNQPARAQRAFARALEVARSFLAPDHKVVRQLAARVAPVALQAPKPLPAGYTAGPSGVVLLTDPAAAGLPYFRLSETQRIVYFIDALRRRKSCANVREQVAAAGRKSELNALLVGMLRATDDRMEMPGDAPRAQRRLEFKQVLLDLIVRTTPPYGPEAERLLEAHAVQRDPEVRVLILRAAARVGGADLRALLARTAADTDPAHRLEAEEARRLTAMASSPRQLAR